MPTKKQHTDDDEWEIAQAAFETARQLPAGAKRFEALKKAGQLRYEADRKRNNQNGRRPVHPDEERSSSSQMGNQILHAHNSKP